MNEPISPELELAVFAKVYELLLSHPIRSAFREADDGPDGEPPPGDPEMLVAVQADRFDLSCAVRELRRKAQQELFVGDFTDTARCALLWVLWHHQGGSSPVGQPLRFALGMGQQDHLTESQIADAKRWAALTGNAGVATVAPRDITPMIDAAMTEMSNIHPPLRRSECERLIRAALGVPELDPRPPFDRTVAAAIVREAWAWAVHGLDDPRNRTEAPAAEPSDSAIEGILANVAVSLPCGVAAALPHPDTARLDHLQRTGSTVELLPGFPGDPLQFRIGGLRTAVDADLRAAIDAAVAGVPPCPNASMSGGCPCGYADCTKRPRGVAIPQRGSDGR